MQYKTVGILGAGAIGSYLIMGLSDKLKENLWIIADHARKEKLETNGLIINQHPYTLHVKTPQETRGVDLLFVCLKYEQLLSSLTDIETVCDEHTVVISLLNGIDSEEIIGQRIGMKNILYSLIRISSHRVGNSINFPLPSGNTGIFIGLPGKDNLSDPRLTAVMQLFEHTPILCHLSNQITLDIWNKFGLNIARNLPQAILDVGAQAYDNSSHVNFLMRQLRHEAVLVANAKGIPLKEEFEPGIFKPNQRYSTLQDLDAHRHTEIEMFSGALIRLGKELGIPCPYNECVYHLIKALEEKNDGKFCYS